MKYLLLLTLAACGGDYNHRASGDVTVTHKIDLASEYFDIYCEEEHPNDADAQEECVAELVAGLIKGLSK